MATWSGFGLGLGLGLGLGFVFVFVFVFVFGLENRHGDHTRQSSICRRPSIPPG